MTNTRTINLRELPTLWPHNVNWAQFFGNTKPVDVEIGTGRTHFFFDRALNFPERNIVGVEWKYEFVHLGQKRIIRDQVPNALAVHGNAWAILPMLFAPQSISNVFVNFPDPWWKNRHKKRLLLNDIFLTALRQRMRDDGLLIIQTDVSDLFDYYRDLIHGHAAFRLDSSYDTPQIESLVNARTHREKKCLSNGLPIYRGVFRVTIG
jgi:tRNA (guanine-N7-)-methyltransferase